MKLAALLLGSALGAAAIPSLPQRTTRDAPREWLQTSFDFTGRLRGIRAPFEQWRQRFE